MGRRARAFVMAAVAALSSGACTTAAPVPAGTVEIGASNHPYIEIVRKQIRERMTYPCVKNAAAGTCEPRSASVRVELGVRRDGTLVFVDVTRSSGLPIYDAATLDAVRRAAPFPPIPEELMATRPAGSTGIPISAQFNYVVEPIK